MTEVPKFNEQTPVERDPKVKEHYEKEYGALRRLCDELRAVGHPSSAWEGLIVEIEKEIQSAEDALTNSVHRKRGTRVSDVLLHINNLRKELKLPEAQRDELH